jgi:hypothetical protein
LRRLGLPPGVGAASARWLFSSHFLAERLPEWQEFRELDVTALRSRLLTTWNEERQGLLAGATRA